MMLTKHLQGEEHGRSVSVVEYFNSKCRNPGQISADLLVSRSNSACHAFIHHLEQGWPEDYSNSIIPLQNHC